ncbi:hypothetical protein BDY21DRAFT_384812 [Lineolata rhizophorae]|uniref:DH domain-containing protein n=1 Tax=Lineolata rhizophorae TaxID=578093 RepID=A0A6A6P4B4_9PEZI|nr:hypothetical protein BDY21DRAFT_384812 [Lineolata rhizophorae]
MVLISPPPPSLASSNLLLFYTTDSLLSATPLLIFYGPSATATFTATNSRIQTHVLSPAGLTSYPRLTVAPGSPLYAAVERLPREHQADEVCRGLAFSLFKFFAELPEHVRVAWERQLGSYAGRMPNAPAPFSDAHAAILAGRMQRVENVDEVVADVRSALAAQSLAWLDVDVVLPPGVMREVDRSRSSAGSDDLGDDPERAALRERYGEYASVARLFGEATFIPTSRLKRAPSKPTQLNRGSIFGRKHKEDVRLQMNELVDTEESYVAKLEDLLRKVADDFRQKAKRKSAQSSSPGEEALKELFPHSLDQILEVNGGFLEALKNTVDETVDEAIADIEKSFDDPDAARYDLQHSSQQPDVTGSVALGKCLLEWFPRFAECYADYIHRHSNFSHWLKMFTKETTSSFAKRVHETGEQRLMSMLIEPVQRLPRYNLYIDSIVRSLPTRHPAIKPLLRARDVISDICSRDSDAMSKSSEVDRFRALVSGWPAHFRPVGRFISAVDVMELQPPYRLDAEDQGRRSGILLLFADHVVYLRKQSANAKNARALVAELDNPKLSAQLAIREQIRPRTPGTDLEFYQDMELSGVNVSEIDSGEVIQLIESKSSSGKRPSSRDGKSTSGIRKARVFHFTGTYEGRAARWIEEFTKARVEGRFSEQERESHKWEVRSVSGDLSLFSAIWEDYTDEDGCGTPPAGRGPPAPFRIAVDPAQEDGGDFQAGQDGLEAVACLTSIGEGFFRLEINGLDGYSTRDHVTAGEFMPVLTKRLSNLLQMRCQIRYPTMTATLLQRNYQILVSLHVRLEGSETLEAKADKIARSQSPAKIFSNLFGGSSKDSATPKRLHGRSAASSLEDIPRMAPPTSNSRPQSRSGDPQRSESQLKGTIGKNAGHEASNHLGKLEETLSSYVLALHARKGNVVGRTLLARSSANELSVNELYNSLLEDPRNHQLAAQVTVDVLFAAFEKFLNIAWRDNMGLVLTPELMTDIQAKSDSLFQPDFEEYFHTIALGDMSPQNQRALRAIVKLLADLLDGTGNDGDRGIMTASFAEMLAPATNPHNFISVLDRFVEDIEALFGEPGTGSSAQGSMTSESTHAAHASKTGSVGSNNSSFRKRFGIPGLNRENSKSDFESKVGAVWRTLSKGGHGHGHRSGGDTSQPASISKAASHSTSAQPPSLSRSKSTDVDARLSPKRPVSRDRPTVLGTFPWEDQPSPATPSLGRPPSSGRTNSHLGTIGEANEAPRPPPRKKRRSSLSDLKSLQQFASASGTPEWATPTATPGASPAKSNLGGTPARQSSAEPRTPTSSNSPLKRPTNIPSPVRGYSPVRDSLKENTPLSPTKLQPHEGSPGKPRGGSIDRTGGYHSPGKRWPDSVSAIPTLKPTPGTGGGLSERPTAGNSTKLPQPPSFEKGGAGDKTPARSSSSSPTKKLRMQSPQKLRERLQNEQKAINNAHAALQAELSKIGEEISSAAPNSGAGTPSGGSRRVRPPLASGTGSLSRGMTAAAAASGASPGDHAALAARVTALESKLPALASDLSARNTAIAADVASSLQVSESRARRLDELYREANAENEALYARFNEELVKVARGAVKGGGGGGAGGGAGTADVQELLGRRWKEMEEEVGRLKRENGRLKREVVGLRAQLKD